MPYLLADNIYQETENIALGKIEKSPLLSELSDWFISMYSVKILNVQLDTPKGSRTDKFGLHVIIENPEEYQKMDVHPTTRQRREQKLLIGLEFKRLAIKYNLFDQTNLDDLFVNYIDFSREAKNVANWRAASEMITQIRSTHTVFDVYAKDQGWLFCTGMTMNGVIMPVMV
jgi:hypothetical protein